MPTNPLAQDLGGVVRLLVPEPKPLPDLLLATYHEARGWNACRDAMLKLIGTHSAEIAGALRDAERWQPIESAPRDGRAVILAHMGGKPYIGKWCHDTWVDERGLSRGPSHWRPLPAPPTQDSAMQQGGGGG